MPPGEWWASGGPRLAPSSSEIVSPDEPGERLVVSGTVFGDDGRTALLAAEASVSTNVVAIAMPIAASSLLETPMNGHSPRNCTRTKLLTSIALINRME